MGSQTVHSEWSCLGTAWVARLPCWFLWARETSGQVSVAAQPVRTIGVGEL